MKILKFTLNGKAMKYSSRENKAIIIGNTASQLKQKRRLYSITCEHDKLNGHEIANHYRDFKRRKQNVKSRRLKRMYNWPQRKYCARESLRIRCLVFPRY